jgi:hypothetical protein
MILKEIPSVHYIVSLIMGALPHRRPAYVRIMELLEPLIGKVR